MARGGLWYMICKNGHNNFSHPCTHVSFQEDLAVLTHQELKPTYPQSESDLVDCGRRATLQSRLQKVLQLLLLPSWKAAPWGGAQACLLEDDGPLAPLTHQQTQARPAELSG